MTNSQRKQQILEFIRDYRLNRGYSPTVREICRHLGLASPGSMMKRLKAMEEEGLLEREPGKSRTWSLTSPPAGTTIPLIGRIAAGSPVLAEENKEADLPIDPALFGCDSTFALQVRGDSMIEAQIRDGDLAIIRPQKDAEDGETVAVLIEDIEPEATLKILRRKKGSLELHPANQHYKPLVFRGKEQSRVMIIGRLVGVIRTRANPNKLFPCSGKGFFS